MILRGLWKFFMCFSQFFLLGGTYQDRHVTIASCLFSLQTCRCSESPRNHQICWGHKSNRQDMPWSSDSINPYHEKCCGCANYSTIYIFNITYVSVSDWFVSSCSSFFCHPHGHSCRTVAFWINEGSNNLLRQRGIHALTGSNYRSFGETVEWALGRLEREPMMRRTGGWYKVMISYVYFLCFRYIP